MDKANYTLVKAGALLAYPMGYLFIRIVFPGDINIYLYSALLLILTAAFVAWNTLILRSRGKRTTNEGKFWFAILAAMAATVCISPSVFLSVFLMILVGAYGVSAAANSLFDSGDGNLIAYDIITTYFSKPFGGIADLGNLPKEIKMYDDKSESKKKSSVVIGIAAVLVFGLLMLMALFFLSIADNEFYQITANMFRNINLLVVFVRAAFAVPVALFLYGLVNRSARIIISSKEARAQALTNSYMNIRKASPVLIASALGVFILLYIFFIVIHCSNIAVGFMGKIPDGLTVAGYARDGYFSLIVIMAINMFIRRTAVIFTLRDDNGKMNKVVDAFIKILMVISLLFAVIAFVRLAMYVNKFGFTVKRLMAIWSTLVLGFASVLAIIGRDKWFRVWLKTSAVSYVVMCIASGVITALGL